MVSRIFFLVASLVASVSAGPCVPRPSTTPAAPTLPSTGGADLPPPNAGLTLKAIAVGHGIQNYTCANGTAASVAAGALAVLYDVTPLYPGTPRTGLTAEGFNALTSTILWSQNIPLNLNDPAAANPGTPTKPNVMPPSAYGATASPFVAPADLQLGNLAPIKYLGRHYFDESNNPTFDVSEKQLRFSVKLKLAVDVPATADKGVLSTGAVKWLALEDNLKGLGNTPGGMVYRVITSGGVGQACSTEGAVPKGSVPYTAFYWFYA